MKKATLILTSLSLLAFASCDDDKAETAPQLIEKTNTVVVEKETPATTAPAPTPPKDEEGNGTSISVGEDGVEFSTKKGNNKTAIDLKKKGASIKIEK